jgi:hypothetical protein
MTKMEGIAVDPHCEECEGEGWVDYGRGEDVDQLPCQKCYPSPKGHTTTWDDLRDDPDDRHDDD